MFLSDAHDELHLTLPELPFSRFFFFGNEVEKKSFQVERIAESRGTRTGLYSMFFSFLCVCAIFLGCRRRKRAKNMPRKGEKRPPTADGERGS